MPDGIGILIFAIFVAVYFLIMALAKDKEEDKSICSSVGNA